MLPNREFFVLSRRERAGLLVAIALLLLMAISPPAYRTIFPPSFSVADTARINQLKLTYQKASITSDSLLLTHDPEFHSSPQAIDPNTASLESLIAAKIPKSVAQNIIRFRAAGAVYRTKQDLSRVYGMSQELMREISPLIVYPKPLAQDRSITDSTPPIRDHSKTILELNSADSLSLLILKGLGPTLVHRILAYRKALGGFQSTRQLNEIYNWPDSLTQKLESHLTVDRSSIQLLDLNSADYQSLNKHPYISGAVAKGIVNYRRFHGRFNSVDEIIKTGLVDEELYAKLAPYLRTP